MATTSIDNVVKLYQDPVPYPMKTDGTSDINAGDMLYFDTAAHVVKSTGSDANNATFVGVALDGSYIQPYSSKIYDLGGQLPVAIKGIFRFGGTTGDTYHDGDSCYYSTDAQHITNTAGGNTHIIGYIKLPPGQTSIAYSATALLQVEITPLWPVTSI